MPEPYKTQGVYIEEIPRFPPSITPVETAIPAFIGYTAKAGKIKTTDLLNLPTKIRSIAEYEAIFGAGAPPRIDTVTLDDSMNFKTATISNQFYMYDSLRLFYANGGGDCYIVSTGVYETAGKTADDFTGAGKGVTVLEKENDPTIIVFPDNSLLSNGTDYYHVFCAALDQCAALQDRVGLFHTKENDPKGDDFRSGIGINNLKYGMVYSPWLKINSSQNITYRDFRNVIQIGTINYKLGDLTNDSAIKALIDNYDLVIADVDKIAAAAVALASPGTTLRDIFTALDGAYLAAKSATTFMPLVNFLFEIARKIDLLIGSDETAVGNGELKKSLENVVSSTLKGIYTTLISYDKELHDKVSTAPAYNKKYDVTPPTEIEWGGIFGANSPSSSSAISPAAISNADKMDCIVPLLRNLFDQINSIWLDSVAGTAQKLESDKHDGLKGTFALYNAIITGLQGSFSTVPPSGAIAGIYAYVDRTRGVWKAPANVSIAGVVGLTSTFTASELDALNVDTNSGKSVNALRQFAGKGTLVYGARTLAGNDNEWRYVNVLRFFNFVEKSTKMGTEQFVFEPNNANTCVKVQTMIENFLIVLWRQGALQGIKPEHAFYVSVGLGKTMTTLDIQEGRMIIEIGMAAVRPAEFIILRFSHKMAES